MTEPLNLYDVTVEGDPAVPPGYRCRIAQFGPGIVGGAKARWNTGAPALP